MPEPDRVIEVVCDWIEKAENDLKTAAHTLGLQEACPADTICFHAQQCVEKYLKAFLVSRGVDFRKTHDVEGLIALMPVRLRPDLSVEEQRRMTGYATVTRYPGEYDPLTFKEARTAVRLARRVRREIRAHLPKAALRRRRRK